MKNYYDKLGVDIQATPESIRTSYRKLSIKYHPDKNDNDKFFAEMFKELNEAYKILNDPSKRKEYDIQLLKNKNAIPNSNFTPEIIQFEVDKLDFEYDKEINFSWKAINCDKVILKPFGEVPYEGKKTYKIKNFNQENLNFALIAENSYINREVSKTITLKNKTYAELQEHFQEKFKKLEQEKTYNSNIQDQIESIQNKRFYTVATLISLIFVIIFIYFFTNKAFMSH